MKITPAIKKYIHHWGEMGIRWGTNRSVAQIQALLYLSPKPLTNEGYLKITEYLQIDRQHKPKRTSELWLSNDEAY